MVVTPFLQSIIPSMAGFNSLSAGIVMGIMIIPFISSLSEDALSSVPKSLREASYGMGATRFQTAFKVMVPAASSGIIVSVILAFSRAIGETMIVAIAAGQQPRLTMNPLVPVETITAYIVQVCLGDVPHGSLEYKTIFAAGITLFVFTFILNNISFWIRKKNSVKSMNNATKNKIIDRIFNYLGVFCTLIGLVVLAIFLINIVVEGIARIDFDFLTSLPSRKAEKAGILTAWVGTLWIISFTFLIAVPLGICAGIYLEEYGGKSKLASILEVNISNLAGVPSVIYGLLGLEIFVRVFIIYNSVIAYIYIYIYI